ALPISIEGGQKDPTTLAFAALSAYRRGEMKDAAQWAKESLEKDGKGPWSSLADSVEHLTEDNVGKLRLTRPKPSTLPGGEDPTPGAVGPKLFPKGVAVSEPLKGVGGLLADAKAAYGVQDFAQVEKLASTVLFSDANNFEALRLRALAQTRAGRYGPALEDAVRGLALKPDAPDLLGAQAVTAGRSGDFATARAAALALLAADPQSAAGLRLLAFANAGLRDRAAMTAALERAAALDAANGELLRRARSLPEDGDLLSLFTDGYLLGDRTAAPLKDSPRGGLAKTLLGVGGGVLAGLALALAALAALKRRRAAAAEGALDLAMFKPDAMRAAAVAGDPPQVGPYKVLGKLGTGGMGVVYKAEDTKLGRTVALKRLRPEIAGEPREHARFLKEARIVSALDHPGIVHIYSVQEAPEGDYLVFEFVEGSTLAELVAARGRLPLAEARSLIAQAADAVAYAHAQGVVHRDLKPSNIMVDRRGRVRVMDFGVARAEKEALSRLTGAETSSGSPPYIAPEQAEGRTTPACDVYALGVCLYELLSGRTPFSGTAGAMHMAKRAGKFPPLGSPVDAVIARALDPDPARRYASPRELAAALGVVPA
ncbi:serine/threonine protein kinase, partial [bacterium]